MENKERTFRETLESMSAKELILLMVDSVENPVTRIDMSSYGHIQDGVCYGCVATNTILKLAKGKLAPEVLCSRDLVESARSLGIGAETLSLFESAINSLSMGYVGDYDSYRSELTELPLPKIKPYVVPLPVIEDNYTQEDLNAYRKLADRNKVQANRRTKKKNTKKKDTKRTMPYRTEREMLYGMELHELRQIRTDYENDDGSSISTTVLRVEGGWLYRVMRLSYEGRTCEAQTFVPELEAVREAVKGAGRID